MAILKDGPIARIMAEEATHEDYLCHTGYGAGIAVHKGDFVASDSHRGMSVSMTTTRMESGVLVGFNHLGVTTYLNPKQVHRVTRNA